MRESLFFTLEPYLIFRFLLQRMDMTAMVRLVCFAELALHWQSFQSNQTKPQTCLAVNCTSRKTLLAYLQGQENKFIG